MKFVAGQGQRVALREVEGDQPVYEVPKMRKVEKLPNRSMQSSNSKAQTNQTRPPADEQGCTYREDSVKAS